MAENKCAARLEPSSRDMSELKNRFKPGYDWEAICSTMLEHLMCGVAIYELCPDRVRSLYFNKKYYEMVGYTEEQYEQYADSVTSSLYGDSAEMIFEKAGRSVKTGETFYAECKGRRFDGSDIWVLVKAKLVDFIESEHPVFLAIVQDITNRKQAEYENAVNLERYRILEATSNAVTFEYDIPDDIMTFSYSGGRADSANRSISNYAEVSKRTKIVYPDDAAKFYAALKKAGKKPVSCMTLDYRSTIIDQNSYRWVRTCYSSVADASGKVIKVLGRTQDIDDEKREHQRMTQLVEIDSTTGLLNKLATTNHIQRLIGEKTSAKSFFIMIDIDDFKAFNDTYGHSFGDEVLRAVGKTLSTKFRNNIIGRFGGDEFIVFARAVSESVVVDKFEDFLKIVGATEIGGKQYEIKCSIGIAWSDRSDIDYSRYFDEADEQLYKAKKAGKCRICHKKID
jgi:diguanylate cyclase (GGDEF)-like protein/PAS domain S-box-containing protein